MVIAGFGVTLVVWQRDCTAYMATFAIPGARRRFRSCLSIPVASFVRGDRLTWVSGAVPRRRTTMGYLDVKSACTRIAADLKARSGQRFSVTHGRGSDYGWITIHSLPSRRVDDAMSGEDRVLLARLLGLDEDVHFQGYSVSPERRDWVAARAAGPSSIVGGSVVTNEAYYATEPSAVLT